VDDISFWDSKEQQLKRYRTEKVVLKRLENIESANDVKFSFYNH